METASDEKLILLLQNRDETALDALRSAYGGVCLQIALRLLDSREDAEECVNDMLLDAWNAVPPHQPENLRAFLAVLVRRAAVSRLRKNTAQKRGGTQTALVLEELAEVLPADADVAAEAEQRELSAVLRRCLDTLPPKERQICMQRYFLAMPLQEIAEMHDMTEAAVKMLLHRTRVKLRTMLEKEGYP